MESKLFEIRDRLTFIPVLAVLMESNYLGRRVGFNDNVVIMMRLSDLKSCHNPFDWQDNNTLVDAHKYIEKFWHVLKNEELIDLEFLRGETLQPKRSERRLEN